MPPLYKKMLVGLALFGIIAAFVYLRFKPGLSAPSTQDESPPPPTESSNPIAPAIESPPPPTESSNPITPASVVHSETPMPVQQTNEEERILIEKIDSLKVSVAALESKVYSDDPPLQTYEQYRDEPSRWFEKNFVRENNAVNKYFLQAKDPAEAKELKKKYDQLRSLFSLSTTKELAENPQFTPALKFGQSALAQGGMPIFSVCDALIGYQGANAGSQPAAKPSPEQILTEFDKRYDLVNSKIQEIVQKDNIPPEVITGIRSKSISQVLTTAIDLYIQIRTPQELSQGRQELKRLENSLQWMRANN